MNAYSFVAFVNGVAYTALLPLLVFKQEFTFKYILFNADMEVYGTEANLAAMKAVFAMLEVVIVPAYFASALKGYTAYIDLSILQRLTVVAATAFLTGSVLGQDVFPTGNFSYTMFLIGDVVPAILQSLFTPGGFQGASSRISQMFKSTPPTKQKKALRLESYMGLVFGFIAWIYAAVVSEVTLSAVVTMLACLLPYVWFWFIAHEPSIEKTNNTWLLLQRFSISQVLLYQVFAVDFGVMNFLYFVQAINILVGAFSSRAAAFTLALSSLYFYKIEADYLITVENGPFWWLVGWGIMVSILSYGWLALFYNTYDDNQKKRIMATHWQDNILGVFMIVVAGGLDRADYLKSDTLGGPVVYLLPFVTLWFSLETKLLTHLWVGTPFHPSWWMYGSTKEGQVPRYAKNDWINVTFSIGTILITAVLTTYAWYATNKAVGFDASEFASSNTWKFAVSHGILFILHSGLWMIIASSGLPNIGVGPAFSAFPPEIKALFQCDPKTCIALHKQDLVLGSVFMFLGSFYLGDGTIESPERITVKVCVAIAWAYSLVSKLIIHSQHRFEPPYFKEGMKEA